VEIEPYCRAVIKQHYPEEILHDDIRTYSAHHLRGVVDGICGGFPCQDISSAGKGAGITGENSGLWKEFARVIGEARPSWALIENSPLLRSRGLEVVLEDLASLGYDAEWGTYRASDVGASHIRDRIWILAYTNETHGEGVCEQSRRVYQANEDSNCNSRGWPSDPNNDPQSPMDRMVDGLADRLVRWDHKSSLAALGNGWVPLQAAEAFKQLWNRIDK
jgi:DNA (cytosine-5)-methyltransferase 1